MKKINKAYGDAKVSLSAMIGKDAADQTTEIPEYIDKVNSIQGIKYYSKDILTSLSKQSKTNQTLIEDNAQLGETLIEYGNWYCSGGTCDGLGNAIKVLGDIHVQMEVCRSKLDIAISNRLHNQINEFMKNDIKDAFLAKSRYDKFRISFDAASETFKTLRKKSNVNAEKLADAEQELDYATQQFSDVSTESLYRMEDIVEKHNEEMFDSVYETVKQYKEYFDKGTEIINAILPDMEQYKKSMTKHKQSINERKAKRTDFIVFEQTSIPATSVGQYQQQQQSTPPPLPTSKFSTTSNSNNNNSNDSLRGSRSSIAALKVFGVPLQVVVDREGRDTPLIVDKAIEYLHKEINIKTEGLFRLSPNQKTLLEAKQLANNGSLQSFDSNELYDDPHLVSSFLKAYLREMPIPLFTFELYKKIIDCVLDDSKDKETMAKSLSDILKHLPFCNLVLVKKLFHLLYSISVESKINKMNTANLAVVLAPNILYPKQMDIQAISNSNAAVEFMISQYNFVFKSLQIPDRKSLTSSTSSNGSNGSNSNSNTPISPNNSGELRKSNNDVIPPKLPIRPVSVMFKQPPLVNNSNNNSFITPSASPLKSSSSAVVSPPPLPPKSSRLSVSTSTLPSATTTSNTNNTSPPPLSPISSTPSSPVINNKPINNRVSVYLSNFNQQHNSNAPAIPPKPSRYSVMIPNTKNSNGADQPPPLAPLAPQSSSASTASSFKKRPQPIVVEQGKSVVKDGVKISHSLLDDSVSYSAVSDNYDYSSSDSLYDWS